MATLRVPSVQHLARNWRVSREAVTKVLVALALSPPRFSYNPLFGVVRDLLVLGVPYDQIVRGIKKEPRERVRKVLLDVIPLIRSHFDGVHPDYYQEVEKRYYPVARGLMVPFQAPMIYGVGGQRYFPWFSFWRSNPLCSDRLSLFVTLVDEIMFQDPDLESARFEILDFSCPKGSSTRELSIIDAREIPRLSSEKKAMMLEVFAEGFFAAQSILAGRRPDEGTQDADRPDPNPNQPDFFK